LVDRYVLGLLHVEVLDDLALLHQRARRAGNLALEAAHVKIAEALLPAITAELVPVVGEVGVGDRPGEAVIDPGHEAALDVTSLEVIAEVVMPCSWSHEQGRQQEVRLHNVARRVGPALDENGAIDADRGEQQTAVVQRVVPVAVDEDATGGAPDVASGHPDPAGTVSQPVAGPPEEARLPPDPATRHIIALLLRRRRGRPALQRLG